MATTFPAGPAIATTSSSNTTTSFDFTTSSSPSTASTQPAPPLQQHLALSGAWKQVCWLLLAMPAVTDEVGNKATGWEALTHADLHADSVHRHDCVAAGVVFLLSMLIYAALRCSVTHPALAISNSG